MTLHVRRNTRIRNLRPQAVAAFLLWLSWCAFAAPALAQAPELRLPPDIVYDRVVGADSAVVFRHASHVDYEGNRCTGCHPRLFHMLRPTHRLAHRDFEKAGACGACHDGKHAFDVRATESCGSCHAGRRAAAAAAADTSGGRAADAFKGPKAFAFARGGDSPGTVTFRHATHLGKSMTCRTCHPRPFAMAGTAPLPDGAMHAPSACGKCHDGKQGFSVEDADACTRCHVEGKGAK